MAKWAVFGEFNIYTGCDDFLGYIDTDEGPYCLDVIERAQAKFPHNEISSHINGKDGIIHTNSEIERLEAWRESQDSAQNGSSVYVGAVPIPEPNRTAKTIVRESSGGWAVVLMIVLVLLTKFIMSLPV